MPKVHLFANIPSLSVETQIYTQRRSNAETPANFKFTVAALWSFILSTFNAVSVASAYYASDETAAIGGVQIGGYYKLSDDNIWGLPKGILKERTE